MSNLSFLSKLLERTVQIRLQAFLDNSDMLPATQSAYRQFHSTESAVLKVYSDLLGQVSALCLLDLTAAFDTVDHDLLMLRLLWCCTPVVQIISFRQVFQSRA